MVGMSPRGARASREKCHVSCPEPTFFAALVGHETLAGDYEVSFVARVMPFVAYGPALQTTTCARKSRVLSSTLPRVLGSPLKSQAAGISPGSRSRVAAVILMIDLDIPVSGWL